MGVSKVKNAIRASIIETNILCELMTYENDFNFQWANLPDPNIVYTKDRIAEFLEFTGIASEWFKGKKCLDAGCGNGRYTYALMQLGADVTSIDVSDAAIQTCSRINPNTHKKSILELEDNPYYDFVLSWGVLHHTPNPRKGFERVASQVKLGGILHVMLYHKDLQRKNEYLRLVFHRLSHKNRLRMCRLLSTIRMGTVHGWWDVLNPTYNWGFEVKEIEDWFLKENFTDIRTLSVYDINMNGRKVT